MASAASETPSHESRGISAVVVGESEAWQEHEGQNRGSAAVNTDYNRACAELAKLGITFDPDHLYRDIEFCGTGYSEKKIIGYYRRTVGIGDGGIKAALKWRPITRAWLCKNSLIGFMFEDGSIRQDAEVLPSLFGGLKLPNYVLFYRDHVPQSMRTALAAGRNLHSNHVIVGK